MSDEMVTWLRARLDDDEAYARNAFGDHNQAEPEWVEIWSGAVQLGPDEDLVLTNDSQVSRHMVRHDPARVLREVEAKRRILDAYRAAFDRRARHPEDLASAGALLEALGIVKLLALPYSDRDGYRDEWRPE